jgi:hypothetical protein
VKDGDEFVGFTKEEKSLNNYVQGKQNKPA